MEEESKIGQKKYNQEDDKIVDQKKQVLYKDKARHRRMDQRKRCNLEQIMKRMVNKTTIMIFGVLVGFLLIGFGVHYNVNSEYSKLNIQTPEKIQTEVNSIYQEIEKIRGGMNQEFDKNGFSDEFNRINRVLQEKESKRADLEERLYKINNHFYDDIKTKTIGKSAPFFVGGVLIIMVSLVASGVLSSLQKNRKFE